MHTSFIAKFHTLLPHLGCCTRLGENDYVFTVSCSVQTLAASDQDLYAVHADLPRLLHYLTQHGTAGYSEIVTLRDTLVFWAKGERPLLSTGSTGIGKTRKHLDRLDAIRGLDRAAGEVAVNAKAFNVMTTANCLDVVFRIDWNVRTIPMHWFEEHYPGSISRIEVMLLMGLTGKEIAALALADVPQVPTAATLPDLVVR